jgi:hypothetical protein
MVFDVHVVCRDRWVRCQRWWPRVLSFTIATLIHHFCHPATLTRCRCSNDPTTAPAASKEDVTCRKLRATADLSAATPRSKTMLHPLIPPASTPLCTAFIHPLELQSTAALHHIYQVIIYYFVWFVAQSHQMLYFYFKYAAFSLTWMNWKRGGCVAILLILLAIDWMNWKVQDN